MQSDLTHGVTNQIVIWVMSLDFITGKEIKIQVKWLIQGEPRIFLVLGLNEEELITQNF